MSQIIALTTFGQVIRWASKGRIFQHLEDRPDFQLPNGNEVALGQSLQIPTAMDERHLSNYEGMAYGTSSSIAIRESLADKTISSPPSGDGVSSKDLLAGIPTHDDSTNFLQPQPHDSPSSCGKTILVDWYGEQDPENPKNWSVWVKAMIYLQINLYTLTVYMSSSIFSATSDDFSEHYGTSTAVTSLGLALYVLGYGIGPMLFSPLSEIPSIGRNPPYIISFSIYVILSVPTAMVRNVPGFMVLRLLQGFFGSPCLATGGASLADVTSFTYLPYGLFVWSIACMAAPALSPTIAGYTVMQKDWTWPMWEILWSTAPCLAFLVSL
jgi:DHA1 family multidrug resistance protein-like MFS transporter